jgi:hypothetical protein
MFISHTHDPSDPLPSQQNQLHLGSSSTDSLSSVIRTPPPTPGFKSFKGPLIPQSVSHLSPLTKPALNLPSISVTKTSKSLTHTYTQIITTLQSLSTTTHLSTDIHAYTHNLPTFLRSHRLIQPTSISVRSTTHLALLARVLAPLHASPVVTPALVRLAARKVYAHRVVVVETAERERSLLWGGDVIAAREMLGGGRDGEAGVGPEEVVEQVLEIVPVPL